MDYAVQRVVAWLALLVVCLLPLVTGLFGLVLGRFLSLRETDPGLWSLRAAFIAIGMPYMEFTAPVPPVKPAFLILVKLVSEQPPLIGEVLGAIGVIAVVFSIVFTWHYWKSLESNEERTF